MKVPNTHRNTRWQELSLSRLQNEGSQRVDVGITNHTKSIKATE